MFSRRHQPHTHAGASGQHARPADRIPARNESLALLIKASVRRRQLYFPHRQHQAGRHHPPARHATGSRGAASAIFPSRGLRPRRTVEIGRREAAEAIEEGRGSGRKQAIARMPAAAPPGGLTESHTPVPGWLRCPTSEERIPVAKLSKGAKAPGLCCVTCTLQLHKVPCPTPDQYTSKCAPQPETRSDASATSSATPPREPFLRGSSSLRH